MVDAVNISAGLRVGFWKPGAYSQRQSPFECKGFYMGPHLGDHIPGARLQQKLMEGTITFQVGVLFRPDLGKRQSLETILMLENWIPEMFNYEDWGEEMEA